VVVALLVFLAGCAGAGGGVSVEGPPAAADVATPTGTFAPADVEAARVASTQLAIDLLQQLTAQDDGNVLLGPASIADGLAMPYLGARGTTEAEMAAVLYDGQPGSDRHQAGLLGLRTAIASRVTGEDGVTLHAASRLFGQRGYGFLDAFLADASRWHSAPLQEVDFAGDAEAARQEINRWTAEQTADRIEALFPPGTIGSAVRLALVSATYLDAPWHFPFNPELTSAAPFTRLDGTTVDVPTMRFNESLPSAEGPDWQAVQLPYRGEQLSMVVIVPADLRAFEASLDVERLDAIREAITDGGIHLALPRFSLSYHTSLIPALRELGMVSAFEDADFSGITGGRDLVISAIEHEVVIEVDEEGTEAAAATGTAMLDSHGPTVTVDRPFLFLVQDDATGAVLYLGRVTDPS
jgi:serpin B